MTPAAALKQVRALCLALPETSERLSHGSAAFFVKKKQFVAFVDNHHGDGVLGIWCAAPPGVQAAAVKHEPARFFVPPYVGPRGWVGIRLDLPGRFDLAPLLEAAWAAVAPPKLSAQRASFVQSAV